MPSMNELAPLGTDPWVLSLRPVKADTDPYRPQGFFVELERTRQGTIEEMATVFLTNRECPFRCLMCDLWKHTTDQRVPDGAIAGQLEWALSEMQTCSPVVAGSPAAVVAGSPDPPVVAGSPDPATDPTEGLLFDQEGRPSVEASGEVGRPRHNRSHNRELRHIKLYNAGNFFDSQAIPPSDLPRIADLLHSFQTVVIECHPRLIGNRCLAFRATLKPALQVAMGLETVHPEVLPRLNKRMTLDDFDRAVGFLVEHGIDVRAFLLLRPPFLTEEEGVIWAERSILHAFDRGVECCVVIPTRAGNGAMEKLQELGLFTPPRLESLEEVLEFGIALHQGRVFVDLWDIEKLFCCPVCGPQRAKRLRTMNLTQTILPPIPCHCRTER